MIVVFGEDWTTAGTFEIRYRYFNSVHTINFSLSVTITFVIIDGCNPPAWYNVQATVFPAVYAPQTYIIGMEQIIYTPANQWVTIPSYCMNRFSLDYSHLITGSAGPAVIFDGTSIIIHYIGGCDWCTTENNG